MQTYVVQSDPVNNQYLQHSATISRTKRRHGASASLDPSFSMGQMANASAYDGIKKYGPQWVSSIHKGMLLMKAKQNWQQNGPHIHCYWRNVPDRCHSEISLKFIASWRPHMVPLFLSLKPFTQAWPTSSGAHHGPRLLHAQTWEIIDLCYWSLEDQPNSG